MAVDQSPMNKLITEHIDIWTSAVKTKSASGRGSNKKLELYGVKKLRELILELAVRGKLVPQNPNDEPASFLLQRISEEKTQLIKEKKITKPKKLPAIKKQDITFALPEGWQACYFGDIYSLVYGDNLPKAKRTESGEFLVYGSNGSVGTHNLFSVGSPCLVIGRKGSAGAINLSDQPCWVTDVAYSLIPPVGISLKYCFLHLQTLGLDSLGKGIKPGLNRNEANALVVCIPPSDEQHRIVAKVDELMALCDQLEQQTEASIEAHQVLVTTLLDTLTNSADADELMQNWARISEHFDTLFTTEENIDQLKQTILQLAVMGKLVPQDPSDEPAAELLKRIAEEKVQLVKEKKIKKQKALPPISEDEKPFELPSGWEWCRLGNLFSFLNGFAFKSEWFNDKGIRLLRNINIAHSETKWADVVCVSAQLAKEYEKYSLNAGDIVISLDRPIINTGLKYAVVDESDLPCLLLQRVAKFHSYAGTVSSSYLSKWLESDLFMSSIDPGRSNGVPHISTKQLEMLPFPLAPLSHQTRISDKVDEMIYLCQQLEIRMKESQITQAHLADAIVAQED
ncbi:restriction endonuclease subunit S [Vibrio parahaemolyticus]|uniref:restriction endonuclease subunit S n=1 Tax=Vibrio parahaemolyticus TaxID=670 RepID=UPI000812E269|nr:restriction endonuclease subunit S [Vibrio parahaemolyticus]MBM5099178.1 restriction endonuclease subunit S [Vibrio parahaemolyticus]MBM5103569.1 restriction endonuclease subunit S [Vibrio parahaemolyticus]MDF4967625.1 restriction endonuclease subunit S [Vibrio parahaemolyticus]OCP61242.1 restriction endonuclease EcoAI subunit S [Vibrio parahaemolyticus]HCE4546798.1 restriction endonuclease subunit S [Vibrio parahaemolyticus]